MELFLEEFITKNIFNIIKNNQKELIKMSSDYPNILKLYYNQLLNNTTTSVYELIEQLNNTTLNTNSDNVNSTDTDTNINTNTNTNTNINTNTNNIIDDIQIMYPYTNNENIEDLIDLFHSNSLII